MNFNVGDIILQKKDKITFTVVEKNGSILTLEYYDVHRMKLDKFSLHKKQIEKQFTDRPADLEHFKVILK